MKLKSNSVNLRNADTRAGGRLQLDDQPARRELGKMLASKLNVTDVQKFTNPNHGKISSANVGRLQSRSNIVSQSRIVVRDPAKSFETSRQSRSESLKVLVQSAASTKEIKPIDKLEVLEMQPIQALLSPPKPATGSVQDLVLQFGIDESRVSKKPQGAVKAYGANTHRGIFRNYNEDRVSIITNFGQDRNLLFAAVYDGHGGDVCADYLKDNLHVHLSGQLSQTKNMEEALSKSIYVAEYNVLRNSELRSEFSGSCALMAVVSDSTLHVANVGDCRAIVSQGRGRKVIQLTNDHKPSEASERERITKAGGLVYQNKPTAYGNINPCRVLPGRLSVSRTIGDLEAKVEKYGGKRNVVVAEPEVFEYKLQESTDFLLLASDGVFDKLSNQEIADIAHKNSSLCRGDVHGSMGKCIQAIMAQVFVRQVTDNVSIVMVGFNNFCAETILPSQSTDRISLPREPRQIYDAGSSPKKPSPKLSREKISSNLASYKRLQTVKEVLRRNLSSRK